MVTFFFFFFPIINHYMCVNNYMGNYCYIYWLLPLFCSPE